MPTYKGKEYAYTAAGKAEMRRDKAKMMKRRGKAKRVHAIIDESTPEDVEEHAIIGSRRKRSMKMQEGRRKKSRRERIAERMERKENSYYMISDVERKRRMARAMRKMGLIK